MVYYDIDSAEGIKGLGTACPVCKKPFPEEVEVEDAVLLYPRQTLISELERVLSVPGVEDACFTDRRSNRKRDRLILGTKIFRRQSDGDLWNIKSSSGEVIGAETDTIRLNLIVDWYQTSRTTFAHSNSNGPILAHIANLPSQARGKMIMRLILGITPGK